TLTLLGNQPFSGPVDLQAGIIAFDVPGALGTNSRIIVDNNAAAVPGSTLRFLQTMNLPQNIFIGTGTATVGLGLDVPSGVTATLSGVISSVGANTKGLYKVGDGDLILTSANNYNGSTQVFAGRLILSGNGQLLSSAAAGGFVTTNTFLVNAGGTLVLDN